MIQQSWAVVTLTRNSRAEFERFLAWYRRMGAARIVLYFHDPNDPNIALIEDASDVQPMILTDALLEELGIRRDDHASLQEQVGTHAYASLDTDWLLRVDMDELIYPTSGETLSQVLARVPPEVEAPVIQPMEVLPGMTPDGKLRLRREMEADVLAEIYGDCAPYLKNRKGLLGHRMGKSICRCGLADIEIRTHTARYSDKRRPIRRPRLSATDGVYLLHFNAEDFWAWQAKVSFRARNASFDPALSARLRELEAMEEAGAEAMADLFERLNVFDAARFQRLVDLGAGMTLDLGLADVAE